MILITGCARSGTSMIAGIIDKCGAHGGNITGPTPNNKKGQFENIRIRNDLVKYYLRAIRVDPLGQKPLPSDHMIELMRKNPRKTWRDEVMWIFNLPGQEWDGKTPLYYKGAKMCLMWPVWHYAFPEAKWVIVRRPDDQIIDSCLRTSFMKAYGSNRKGWQQWIDVHKKRWREMSKAGCEMIEVWSNEIVEDYTKAKGMINWLELEWNKEAVLEFVTPELYHTNPEPF